MAFNDIEISMGMNKNTPYTHAKSPKSRSSRIDIMDATKLAKIDFDNGRDHSGNGQTRPIWPRLRTANGYQKPETRQFEWLIKKSIALQSYCVPWPGWAMRWVCTTDSRIYAVWLSLLRVRECKSSPDTNKRVRVWVTFAQRTFILYRLCWLRSTNWVQRLIWVIARVSIWSAAANTATLPLTLAINLLAFLLCCDSANASAVRAHSLLPTTNVCPMRTTE